MKAAIAVGDLFKATFAVADERERMWAECVRIDKDIVYGVLRNEPAVLPAKFGDPVWVRKDGIHETKPQDPRQ